MKEAVSRIQESLRQLTDFQRATVEVVFRRLTSGNGSQSRVLVADEVGLGKTLVARGVIGMLLEARIAAKDLDRPLRVAYICSNQTLADENRRKLAIFKKADADRLVHAPSFGRLADLGMTVPHTQTGKLLEICTLTPATSFATTRGDGNARERYIIWRALSTVVELQGAASWLEHLFRKGVGDSWDVVRDKLAKNTFEPKAMDSFRQRLCQRPGLAQDALRECNDLGVAFDTWHALLSGLAAHPKRGIKSLEAALLPFIRTRLRSIFVECCAQNLEADLFILDEFQRFRELIGKQAEGEEGIIAARVLHQGDCRALLLSATPFKALSHVAEDELGKAHVHELRELLSYLSSNDKPLLDRYEKERGALLEQLVNLPVSLVPGARLPDDAKRRVELTLRPLLCRTERGQIGSDDAQTVDLKVTPRGGIDPAEVEGYVGIDLIGQALQAATRGASTSDIMQFHKAAPWCLSFLGDYQLRKQLEKSRSKPAVQQAISRARSAWLSKGKFESFEMDLARDTPHFKFRALLDVVMNANSERMLWMPPSLPYYGCEGPFKGHEKFTKTLLFSGLVLAPRALSSLLSYQADRRLRTRGQTHKYSDARSAKPLFRYDGRSMSPAWALAYPCRRLSAIAIGPGQGSLQQLRSTVKRQLANDVGKLAARFGDGDAQRNNRWYVLAPFLLDRITSPATGVDDVAAWATAYAENVSTSGRGLQRARLLNELRDPDLQLGSPPSDLIDYIVDLAIAGPAVCWARASLTMWPALKVQAPSRLKISTQFALSFIDMANRSEPQQILRKFGPLQRPWKTLLSYSAEGNLQAVLDEYAHLLASSSPNDPEEALKAVQSAMGLQTAPITAQTSLPLSGTAASRAGSRELKFTCHYAVPLGNQKSTDEGKLARIGQVRGAFNSPFWPFVLNSTSVGQEGLDFHWYCGRVVHWSLPSNPIDLEQREGRVNRFKSLVVRRRLAEVHSSSAQARSDGDPWAAMFVAAKAQPSGRKSDLVPYWHVPGGTSQIERFVPMLPFSREVKRLDEILRVLSLYRLAFGQPRQQEMLETLLRRQYTAEDIKEIRRALMIDLAPINYAG